MEQLREVVESTLRWLSDGPEEAVIDFVTNLDKFDGETRILEGVHHVKGVAKEYN